MTTIDTNVSNYTLSELIAIAGINVIEPDEIIEKTDKQIKRFKTSKPDISVFCDLSKLDDRGAIDAPDLVVEITSDSTMKKDYNEKFNIYEENNVQEYWIVNPDLKSMELFKANNSKLESVGVFNVNDGVTEVSSVLFPELTVNLIEIFKD